MTATLRVLEATLAETKRALRQKYRGVAWRSAALVWLLWCVVRFGDDNNWGWFAASVVGALCSIAAVTEHWRQIGALQNNAAKIRLLIAATS